jgi:hypothetical protein
MRGAESAPFSFFLTILMMTAGPDIAVTDAGARRGRGRPVKVWRDLSLEEVARALGFAPAALERLLVAAPGCLPGAECVNGVWRVEERDLLRFLGDKGGLEQRVTVRDVAEALRVHKQTVYDWLALRDPRSGMALLPSHKVLGHIRIFARDVLALPAEWPLWAPARPSSFFCAAEEGSR